MVKVSQNKERNRQYRRERRLDPALKAMDDAAQKRSREKYGAKYALNARVRYFKKKYGITPEHKAKMLKAQKGRCAICGTEEPRNKKTSWHLDHCHATGALRGVLCAPCNQMLGHAKDNPDILQSAIHYLELARIIG